MRVTIVRADNFVIVDGVSHIVDCSSLPSSVRVIQWDQSRGHIEYINDTIVSSPDEFRANEVIVDFSPLQYLVDAWQIEHSKPPPPAPVIPPEVQAELDKINALKADAARQELVEMLMNASPAQIRTYVQNQVTDLASARSYLVKLTLLIAAVVRR